MTTTETTLGNVQAGDEILSIRGIPAARITAGIPWTDEPQRLVVTSVWTNGEVVFMSYANGGKMLPNDATKPCVVAR